MEVEISGSPDLFITKVIKNWVVSIAALFNQEPKFQHSSVSYAEKLHSDWLNKAT